MLKMAQPYLSKSASDLDRKPYLFNCQNGTLDLRTGKLRPHHKSAMITQLADVVFDPQAKAPRFERFVDEIFNGDGDLAAFVQKAFGYSLTGDTKEQVLFLLYGSGANGKSTLVELMRSLLGDYGKTAQADTLMQKAASGSEASPDIARLKGARLISLSEGDRTHKLNEALVKQLTGTDTVTTRALYKEPFEFKPEFKMFLSTNHLPKVTGSDHGMWRRVMSVPFLATFEGDRLDPDLSETLQREKSGVLNWLLEGCMKWQQEGLNPPQAVLEAKAYYRSASDHIARYLDDRTELAINATMTKADLYKDYQAWCIANGERFISNREFGEAVGKREGVAATRTKSAHCWTGIRLVPVIEAGSEPRSNSFSPSW